MPGSETWLVTGAGGQLATRLAAELAGTGRVAGDTVHCLGRDELDVTSAESIDAALARVRPTVVVNAAAYTAVDAAEDDEARADRVNAVGPGLLARALARRGGRLIHVSTDYVFDGTADRPYRTTDEPAPTTAYGRTKLTGERAVLTALPGRANIVRTAWLHGGPGRNFLDSMLALERRSEQVHVVADQIGSPTFAGDLAGALVELGRARCADAVLHYANSGTASWFELARAVFAAAGADPARVRPTTSAALGRRAARPAWSVLDLGSWTRAGLRAPRHWRPAVQAAVTERAALA